MLGWLDKRSPAVQHALVALAVALLVWAAQDALPAVSPWLDAHPPLGPLAGYVLTQGLLWLTPIVRSYGAGKGDAPGRHADAGLIEIRVQLRVILAVILAAVAVTLCLATMRADAGPGSVPASSSPRPSPSPATMPTAQVDADDLVLVAASSASHRGRPVDVTGVKAYACEGTLLVVYSLEREVSPGEPADPRALPQPEISAPSDLRLQSLREVLQDDGDVVVQLHSVGGREGLQGTWRTVPATSGGEAWRRWPGLADAERHGAQYDLVRVVRDRRASVPAPITDGCAA